MAETLLDRGGVRIEQIVSGTLPAPVEYRQDEDEWVVLLSGAARLRVGESEVELAPGDWLYLPARLEHRLEWTAPGSTWLAVFAAAATVEGRPMNSAARVGQRDDHADHEEPE